MAPTTRNCATIFPSTGELGTDAISDPSLSEDHIEKDPVGSFFPAAQTSRRPFETTPSAACANIEQAAAAAENIPDVRLMPPLEDGTAPQELFTPKTGRPAIRSHSGGSSAGPAAPPKKRRNRDKQQAPLVSPNPALSDDPASAERLCIRIPARPPISPPASVLDCLASCSPPIGLSLPSADTILACTFFREVSRNMDLADPNVREHLRKELAHIAPEPSSRPRCLCLTVNLPSFLSPFPFAAYPPSHPLPSSLPSPFPLPSSTLTLLSPYPPLPFFTIISPSFTLVFSSLTLLNPFITHLRFLSDLPNPSVHTLLPGFHLVPTASSSVCSLPRELAILDGYDLELPHRVVAIMKANWSTHIPLTALTTCSLASTSLAAKDEAGQALAVRDGVLSLSSPKISAKDKGSLSPQDWIHAFPRLVSCIRKYLPSPSCSAIADAWQSHFNGILHCSDFWDLFHLYLCYDIRLRLHFVNADNVIDPSIWGTIIDAYCMGSQSYLSGLGGIAPPAPRSAPSSVATNSSFPSRSAPPPYLLCLKACPIQQLSCFGDGLVVPPARLSSSSPMASGKLLKLNTRLKAAISDGFLPIVTPFHWERWEALLQEAGALEEFSDVPKGICFVSNTQTSLALISTPNLQQNVILVPSPPTV
ncbi:hypothetical protein BS17DRAFT_813936 [Gyrodon lividus]|nr:hypothetical protein BS17DRAFT_813936 [Gyrodon lividus]